MRSLLGLGTGVAWLLGLAAAGAALTASDTRPASDSPSAGPPPHPERIVSTHLATDEVLLGLGVSDRVVALSNFADDPEISNALDRARRVPHRVGGEAEPILALRPDLVFAFPFGQAEMEALLRAAAVPVVHVPGAATLADVRTNIRRIARTVGATEQGRALIADMDAELESVRAAVAGVPRPRAMLWHTVGTTAGGDTLFTELLDVAGGRNAAAEAGVRDHETLPMERVLAIDPEVVFVVDYRADASARDVARVRALREDSLWAHVTAVRDGRVYPLSARHVLTGSHHVARAARDMAEWLHPQRFLDR